MQSQISASLSLYTGCELRKLSDASQHCATKGILVFFLGQNVSADETDELQDLAETLYRR